ncbi:MAG: hypothetical protein QOI12_2767 [Alphaproteobacteria bacterium]|nr:hypothetical protein [Alphaproteobacteria bacterium]
MGLISAIIAAAFLPFVELPPTAIWPVLALSLVLHSGYRFSLALAYADSDLSQAYPLARGLVPIFAMATGIWLLSQTPSMSQLLGIGTISAGVCWLTSEAVRNIQAKLLLAAAGVGLTVAGYSVLDSYGARVSGDWMSYTVWLVVLDSGTFTLLVFALRRRRFLAELAAIKERTAISGLLGLVSFTVFIWALSRNPVGAVSALRETSILFATLIGIFWYKERLDFGRLSAAGLITLGIALVSISK